MRAAGDHDEHALVRRAGAGEAAAWQALVDAHLAAVHRTAWYMLGDRAEAEDVAQEAFVRLMTKASRWQPDGARLGTWLYRVTVNLCIDRQRQRRRFTFVEDMKEMADTTFATALDHRIDLGQAIRAALDALNPRQRAAVLLVHYQGQTNIEAAAALDVSIDALESLLARARRALRQSLTPSLPDLLGDGPASRSRTEGRS